MKRIATIAVEVLVLLVTSLYLGGSGGCGGLTGSGGSGDETTSTISGDVSIQLTLQAPPSTGSSALMLGEASAASEVPQPGRVVFVYRADPTTGQDVIVGYGITNEVGQVTIPAYAAVLGQNPNLFVKTNIGVGGMGSPSVTSPGSAVSMTLNSASDLALQVYRAKCQDLLGSAAPAPGDGLAACSDKLRVDFVQDIAGELAGTGSSVDGGSIKGLFNAALDVNRENIRAGLSNNGVPPGDMVGYLLNDSTAVTSMQNVVGKTLPASLSLDVSVSDMPGTLSTVVKALDQLGGSASTTAYHDIQSLPQGNRFGIIGDMKAEETSSVNFASLGATLQALPSVDTKGEFAKGGEVAHREIIESVLSGAIGVSASKEEATKVLGVAVQAGVPATSDDAKTRARALVNVVDSDSFKNTIDAGARNAVFGTMLNADGNYLNNVISGGPEAVERIVNAGVSHISQKLSGASTPTSQVQVFKDNVKALGKCGDSCTVSNQSNDCSPGLSCTGGKCLLPNTTTCPTGGIGNSCANESSCATGLKCDTSLPSPICYDPSKQSTHSPTSTEVKSSKINLCGSWKKGSDNTCQSLNSVFTATALTGSCGSTNAAYSFPIGSKGITISISSGACSVGSIPTAVKGSVSTCTEAAVKINFSGASSCLMSFRK